MINLSSDFYKDNFINGADILVYYKNYQISLEKYFQYYNLVSNVAEDIDDGLIVNENIGTNHIDCMIQAAAYCMYFKELIGSTDPIIDLEKSYEIRGEKFSLREVLGDKAVIEVGANGFVRSFTRNHDFYNYEVGVLALYVINRI